MYLWLPSLRSYLVTTLGVLLCLETLVTFSSITRKTNTWFLIYNILLCSVVNETLESISLDLGFSGNTISEGKLWVGN